MEPAAKRRRRGRSPLAGADEDDDGDELCFEPLELSAKRDPGYRLSLQRAYADSRFQATMAHIFEKYGRDFDGIGDEIDMVSGEVVVDNGHLQNMRDEGDVGTDDQESDEDQGILLQDLIEDDEQDDEQDDEEDDIMYGRKSVRQSQALVPVQRPRSPNQSFSSSRFFGDGLYGPGFGAPFAFGASPLAFGIPTMAGPVPSGLSGSALGPPGLSPTASRLLPSPGQRYNFPVQDCGSSIWAPNYRFKEDGRDLPPATLEFASMRPRPKTRTRPMKTICPSAVSTVDVDEEVDEDAILTGKSALPCQSPQLDVPRSRQNSTEDLSISPIAPKGKSAAPRMKPCHASDQAAPQISSAKTSQRFSKAPVPKKKKKKDAFSSRGAHIVTPAKAQCSAQNAASIAEARSELASQINGHPPRRQDKQRHAGEASCSVVRKQEPSRQRIAVEIASMDGLRRDEYEEVDEAVEEVADSADEELEPARSSAPRSREGSTGAERMEVASVSRDTPVPQNSDDGCGKAPERDQKAVGEPYMAVSSAFCLSDDEMPIWSKPKGRPRTAKGHQELVEKPASPITSLEQQDLSSSTEDSAAAPSPDEVAVPPSVPRASGSPQLAQSEARRQPTRPQAVLRRAGLASPPPPQPVEQPPVSAPGDDAAESGVSATHDGGRSRRLTRELRWLRKLNGPDLVTPHTSSSPTTNEPPPSRPATRAASGSKPRAEEPEPADGQQDKHDGTPVEAEDASNHSADTPPSRPASSNQEHTAPASPTAPASQTLSPVPPSKPQTPRHTSIRPTKAPSSRRSILSLVSPGPLDDDDDDDDVTADEKDPDELGRSLGGALSTSLVSSGASRKIWKSSARTTEIYHTPVKRRPAEVLSPSSIIRTPGGTLRACGIAGYRCGRDFCFSCL